MEFVGYKNIPFEAYSTILRATILILNGNIKKMIYTFLQVKIYVK